MQNYFKIRFSIVITLMILLGAASIYFINNIYITTKNMYEHPYRVSNELKAIKISVHQMHLLLQNENNIDFLLLGKIDASNRESLDIISVQYLGDSNDIETVKTLYEQWASSSLSSEKQFVETVILGQLLSAIETLALFADNKAEEFYHTAKHETRLYTAYISVALLVATIISMYLLMHTLKTLREVAINRKQYRYLIDQNVMIAAIDDDGLIFDVSNRLSRFISAKKEDLLAHPFREGFFCHDDEQFEDMWQLVKSGATWHGEIPVTDGNTTKWLGVDVLPMQDSDYSYSGFRLLAHDISSRISLEKISMTDTLTGLLNRRSLDEVLERQTKLAIRNKQPLTVGMLDVDFFKQYNDCYGHPAGDKVLTHLASVLMKFLGRPDDFVFRMGGEEFFFIFNSHDEDGSETYVEKIRAAVTALNIEHKESTVDEYLSVSIGAVYFAGESIVDGKLLLSDADDNLYKAKELRNCVVQTVEGEAIA